MGKIKGKCLCESIEYEIEGALGPVYNCHCSKCRRWHGAAFRTRASIEKSQLKWISGEENLSFYKSSENVTKHFCKVCGSALHSTYEDKPNILGIPIGGLEGVTDISPGSHIFVSSKATWYEITDGKPTYGEWPGSEELVRETNT